jgi:hypothetical protein
MIIPARYTEVLDNLLRNPQTATAIGQAMSTYPLYATDPTRVEEYGTAYTVPTRQQLNDKILSYYRFREIGFETVGRFLFELETALKEIMPYYNQLFYSADQDFNPIYNVDYIRNTQRNKSDTNIGSNSSSTNTTTSGTDSSSSTDYSKNVKSDTPQNQLNIPNEGIDTVSYASEADWGKNSNSTSGNSSTTGNSQTNESNSLIGNEKEGIVETTKGNFGVTSAQDLILKYRETILNIEQLIINDPRIKELFMLIY